MTGRLLLCLVGLVGVLGRVVGAHSSIAGDAASVLASRASVLASRAKEVSDLSSRTPKLVVKFKNKDRVNVFRPAMEGVMARVRALQGAANFQIRQLDKLGFGVLEFDFGSNTGILAEAARGILSLLGDSITVGVDEVIPLSGNLRNNTFPVGASIDVDAVARSTSEGGSIPPNDPFSSKQWNLERIRAVEGWGLQTGLEDPDNQPLVVVIDSGIDCNHPDMRGSCWINEAELNGVEGVDDDGNGYVDDVRGWNPITGCGHQWDNHGHGSNCAGIIGAQTNNGEGLAGINWGAKLVPCKAGKETGMLGVADIFTCMDYAISIGARVSSNSYGGPMSPEVEEDFRTAIERAGEYGHIYVTSAGNWGVSMDETYCIPGGMTGLENKFGVASISSINMISLFSSYHPELVEMAAPGERINTIIPNNTYTGYYQGTSAACPHVAAVISLMLARKPDLTVTEIRTIMKETSGPFLDWEKYTAWGTLDMYSALQAVEDLINPPTTAPTTTSTAAPTTTSTAAPTTTSTAAPTTTSTAAPTTTSTAAPTTTSTAAPTTTSTAAPTTTSTAAPTTTSTAAPTTTSTAAPTAAPTTCPEPTTSTTTLAGVSKVVLVDPRSTCYERCELMGGVCEDTKTERINQDHNVCYEELVASGMSDAFKLGSEKEVWTAPTGCYVDDFSVSRNSYDFNTRMHGCKAPPAKANVLKACVCNFTK